MTGKCEHFAMMTSFDLVNIDLGSLNLHRRVFIQAYRPPLNFVFLAVAGAEIAEIAEGGGTDSAPHPFQVSGSPEKVKMQDPRSQDLSAK